MPVKQLVISLICLKPHLTKGDSMTSAAERIKYWFEVVVMKRDRQAINNEVRALGRPILRHIMKLSLYGNIDRTWSRDILLWLKRINSITLDNKGNKRLTSKEYFDELWPFSVEDRFQYTLALDKVADSVGKAPLLKNSVAYQILSVY